MEPVIVWYLRMSLIYFVAGAIVGICMLLWPDAAGYYISAHAHLNLLGFMSMMIYGVGYHILPRFSGRNVYSPAITRIQFWVANAGLIGMAITWPLVQRSSGPSVLEVVLVVSAFLSLLSVVLFAFNILKTIQPIQMPQR
jgi:cbb3-type cytochrome oxidase subunit 1